jgi:hypothetical protein
MARAGEPVRFDAQPAGLVNQFFTAIPGQCAVSQSARGGTGGPIRMARDGSKRADERQINCG